MTRSLATTRLIGLLATAAIGCAGTLPEARHGVAAGEWQVHLPSAPGPFARLALGRDSHSQPAIDSQSEAPQLVATANPPAVKKHARISPKTPSAVTAVALSTPPPLAVESNAPSLAEPMARAAPTPTLLASANQTTAEQRYAQRDSESRKLQDFKGGDVIVISAGALVIVLLIVILILLLRR